MATAEEIKAACKPMEFTFTVPPEFIAFLKNVGDATIAKFKEQNPETWEQLKERFPHLAEEEHA